MIDLTQRWQVIEGDCLQVLRELPDGCVDAVVTDPPYGIGADEAASKNEGKWGWKDYGHTEWDRNRPPAEAFQHILRVCRQAAIWGGNYFADLLPPSMGWLARDKGQRDFSLADFELCWTTEQKAARCLPFPRAWALKDGKEHPTQKPVGLMEWVVSHLMRSGGKPIVTVLDPYAGSGSTGVACMKLGVRFVGVETNPSYCAIARRRIAEAANTLWTPEPVKVETQELFVPSNAAVALGMPGAE